MFGRLEGAAGGAEGRPFTVDGAGGYVIGTGGGTNESAVAGGFGAFVDAIGAFASMAARSVEGGGRLGVIGLSGELSLSELPPTIAIGDGAREGASGALATLSPSALLGDVMLEGLLGGGGGAGAPLSR